MSVVIINNLDLKNRTASGTFSGTLVNANGKSVNITNGIFKNVSITVYQRDSELKLSE